MANNKDYYAVLGVNEKASKDEIDKVYRKLAMELHPDRNPDPAAQERFKDVTEAHSILSDDKKRQEYDMIRKYGAMGGMAGGPGGAPGGFDFSGFTGGGQYQEFDLGDLKGGFGNIFDLLFNQTGTRQTKERERYSGDIYMEIEVPFSTSVKGGTAKINIPRSEPCMTCAGSGAAPGTYPKTCPNCEGTGTITQGLGQFGVKRACPTCGGKGTVIEKPCPDCKGTGSRRGKHKISVRIPAGIQDGGKLRVRGEGNALPNGRRGDLIITVKVKGSKTYTRDGLDTNSSITLNLSEAVMGCQKVIKTPQGNVKIKIPAGVATGKKIRVKKKGIRDERTGRQGDHYVKVTVEIPKKMNSQQKKLFKEYSAAMGWDE